MAIDFTEKENNFDSKKVIILIIVLILGVILFIFFKNGAFGSEQEITDSKQMFQPIDIDFNFISSEEFKSLEKFRGIPVLPGFFDASDNKTQAEKIEHGRENPFKAVSSEEIELAVTKVIQKLNTFEELEEMRNIIQNSSLYEPKQKESLLEKLDEQNEILEKLLRGEDDEEYTNEDEDVPLNDDEEILKDEEVPLNNEETNEDEDVPFNNEEIDGGEDVPANDEKIDYYKEW